MVFSPAFDPKTVLLTSIADPILWQIAAGNASREAVAARAHHFDAANNPQIAEDSQEHTVVVRLDSGWSFLPRCPGQAGGGSVVQCPSLLGGTTAPGVLVDVLGGCKRGDG
jgi:hypothetical protein